MPSDLTKKISTILQLQEYGSLFNIWSKNRKVIRILISLTYDKKDIIAWRAIEGLGILSGSIAETEPAAVRNLAGRLLWMIRDESGGIGWSSPEMLGEIVRNNPVLCADIAPIIISFHDEEPLLPGILWAAGRIGERNRELIIPSIDDIVSCLSHYSPLIRGLAVLAVGKIKVGGINAKLKELAGDNNKLRIYDDNHFIETTVGSIASKTLEKSKTAKPF